MWIVAKIKKKELNNFKVNLIKKIGKEIKFYHPKIICHKYFAGKFKKIESLLLENYIFCYHEEFSKINSINNAKFSKGLEYFLKGHDQNQKEIINFINHCKSFEDKDGYLTASYFKDMAAKKGKFISGPLTNMIFEIIERQSNKLKIIVGNIVTTVSDNKNYLYRPI